MTNSVQYSPEIRDQAVRMVFEHERDHTSRWAAMVLIAGRVGCTPEALRNGGRRPRSTQDGAAE